MSAAVLLWVLIAFLTAAAVMAVLVPLGRAPARVESAGRARGVYIDQLRELERDRTQGRISGAEAEGARAELARRLIATQSEKAEFAVAGSRTARRGTAVAALLGIPALSLGLYLSLGAPNLPGQPLASRFAAADAEGDIAVLLARIERHLGQAPEDGPGWDVIAPVYARLGRAGEAATAYRNAIRLLGSNAARQTGLGEALLAKEGGVVTANARQAFAAANAADPAAPAPRFYLALAAEQEGDLEAAASGWRALLAEAPPDAPWRNALTQALARVEPASAQAEQALAPGADPDEQAEMIEAMVAGLAERLESQPNDVEGWLRLIRSYVVLGRTEEAEAAAHASLQGLPAADDRQRVEALLADLGLSGNKRDAP
jgi:cytochrome c-type biogenesis protein CcmH